MTATMTAPHPTRRRTASGGSYVSSGPVVDVEFAPDEMPDIYNALTIEIEVSGEEAGR